jgi:GAF domain-containing protein
MSDSAFSESPAPAEEGEWTLSAPEAGAETKPELEAVLLAAFAISQTLLGADALAVWRVSPTGAAWEILWSMGLSAGYPSRFVWNDRELLGGPYAIEDVELALQMQPRLECYRQEGIRAILAVPLRVHGENCGTVTLYYRDCRKFGTREQRAASALATITAFALER